MPNEIVFPSDKYLKSQMPIPLKLKDQISISDSRGVLEFRPPPTYAKKGRSQSVREKVAKRTRDPVKFGGGLSSSGSDFDEDELMTPPGFGRLWLGQRRSSSPPVSVGFATSLRKIGDADIDVEELGKVKTGLGAHNNENPDYSDFEEDDVTSAAMQKNRDSPGWSPDFLRRHSASGGTSTTSQRTVVERPSPAVSSPPAPEGAVPMTLSLIKAIDRIAVAQQAAYDAPSKPLTAGLPLSKSSELAGLGGLPQTQASPSPLSSGEDNLSERWDAFWKDVREKAAHTR
jgi:hypothetical protein